MVTVHYLLDREAFYSALHFIRYKLFPFTLDDICENFEHCCSHFFLPQYENSGKHEKLELLVKEFIPDVALDFKELKNECWTARYKKYQLSKSESDSALGCLHSIKSYCESKQSNMKVSTGCRLF